MAKTISELGKLDEQIQALSKERYQLQRKSKEVQEYFEIENKLVELEKQLREETEQVANTIETWAPDKFSKCKKDIARDGNWVILRSKRTIRTIKNTMFLELYPLLANVMIENGDIRIPLGVVENEIGKKRTNEMCDEHVTYSYQFQSREYEPLVKDEKQEEQKNEHIGKKPANKKTKSKRTIKANA